MRGPPRQPAERPPRRAPRQHTGVIHGVRRWAVHIDERYGVLCGYAGAGWLAGGKPTRARCLAATPSWSSACVGEPHASHPAPGPDCSCGLYAVHPRLATDVPTRVRAWAGGTVYLPMGVLGVVEAWGRIELHSQGFRAEFARPVALAVHSDYVGGERGRFVAALAERYDAICVEANDPIQLAGWCEREGLGLAPAAIRQMFNTSGTCVGSHNPQ